VGRGCTKDAHAVRVRLYVDAIKSIKTGRDHGSEVQAEEIRHAVNQYAEGCYDADVSSAVQEKKAVAWFYYLALKKEPRWEYFFVAYDHLVGLNRVSRILNDVEQHNFSIATRKES
jgi:hypothetical protein